MRTLLPASGPGAAARRTYSSTRWGSGAFAFPSSTSGGMIPTIPSRYSMFLRTAGFSYITWCMAGQIVIGMPAPRAVVRTVETGVSSIPLASLPRVLAVAGYTMTPSARPLSAIRMCSRSPVRLVTTSLPVAHRRYSALISPRAAWLATQVTLAPCRISSLARSTALYAATLPATHRTSLLPRSPSPREPVMSSDGWGPLTRPLGLRARETWIRGRRTRTPSPRRRSPRRGCGTS